VFTRLTASLLIFGGFFHRRSSPQFSGAFGCLGYALGSQVAGSFLENLDFFYLIQALFRQFGTRRRVISLKYRLSCKKSS
jgi:hypothetical protein